GKYSGQRRWERIQTGLSEFKKNPWMGQSLGSSFNFAYLDDRMITHNDYISLLSETGLMGAIPFLFFLIFFSKELMQVRTDHPRPFSLRASQASFLALLFLSNFLNIYTSMHYWFFLALALKTKQISEAVAVKEDQS
ncbi:MAG: O-antigen ligase family protein, partial [Deltaproteobacteria bacterium]|nr:O-antigen ligase family protein [Deltaproteobacteria bacterium]